MVWNNEISVQLHRRCFMYKIIIKYVGKTERPCIIVYVQLQVKTRWIIANYLYSIARSEFFAWENKIKIECALYFIRMILILKLRHEITEILFKNIGLNIFKDYSTGLSKKMDGIWNRYNLKSTGRIYTFYVLKCSEEFKVLDLP